MFSLYVAPWWNQTVPVSNKSGGLHHLGLRHGRLASSVFDWSEKQERCHTACLGEGFPQRREILENKNGHGKVTEHEILPKNHGTLSRLTHKGRH